VRRLGEVAKLAEAKDAEIEKIKAENAELQVLSWYRVLF